MNESFTRIFTRGFITSLFCVVDMQKSNRSCKGRHHLCLIWKRSSSHWFVSKLYLATHSFHLLVNLWVMSYLQIVMCWERPLVLKPPLHDLGQLHAIEKFLGKPHKWILHLDINLILNNIELRWWFNLQKVQKISLYLFVL